MADYPDFTQFAYIDIWTQTLGRVLMRPTYGGCLNVSVALNNVVAGWHTLADIEGEGMIYGGMLAVYGGDSQIFDNIRITIDDTVITGMLFGYMAARNFTRPYGVHVYNTLFDTVNHTYAFIVPYGATFEENYKLEYHEALGNTPDVDLELQYAVV